MNASQLSGIEKFLCAFLRGENPSWPQGGEGAYADDLLERAAYHGVLPLVHDRLQREPGSAQGWPQQVLQACRSDAIDHAMWELRHQDLLTQVLARLARIDVRPVLFKGTALAYSLYPNPVLRTRGDTDLLVPASGRFRVAEALESLGFERMHDLDCEFVSYEANFNRGEAGALHALDLHWRVHYSQFQARIFPYEALRGHAQPLPRLCPDALGVSAVHALLLACLHRANNLRLPEWHGDQAVYGADRLIWLYDLHLLIGNMAPTQLDEFVAFAEDNGMQALCWEGIELAQTCFHTRVPESVCAALSGRGLMDTVIRYQTSGMLRQRWMDLRAIDGVRRKFAYLFEHVFPREDYMRERYPDAYMPWLPWLYLRRFVEGVWRRLCLSMG